MEENKGCAHGDCENCKDKKICCGGHGCCGKYHLLGAIVVIFLIVAIFCVGAMFGRNNDFRGRDVYQRFMMSRNSDSKTNLNDNTGSVTVKVLPTDTTNGATTPPVQQ